MIAYKNKLFNDFSLILPELPLYSWTKTLFLLYYLHFYAQLSQEISNRMQCVSCLVEGIVLHVILKWKNSFFFSLFSPHSVSAFRRFIKFNEESNGSIQFFIWYSCSFEFVFQKWFDFVKLAYIYWTVKKEIKPLFMIFSD